MRDPKQVIRDKVRPPDAAPGIESGITTRDIVFMLKRHIGFIVFCTILCLAVAAAYVHFVPPVYEAIATLRLDPSRGSSLGLSDPANAAIDQNDVFHTETVIVRSDGVAKRVLNSLSDSEFYKFARGRSTRSVLPQGGNDRLTGDDQQLIDLIELNSVAKQEDGTQLMDIKFRDRDPEVAALIANHLADAYIAESFNSRERSVEQLRESLSAQMAALQARVKSSQEALAAFEENNKVIGNNEEHNTITDRLALLNQRLTEAQTNRITKEAQMRAANSGNPATLVALYPDPRLQALQAQQGNIDAEVAQLSSKFAPKYLPLVQKKEQLKMIQSEMDNSVQSIKNQLTQQYATAKRAESMLQAEYDQQASLAYNFTHNQAQYAALQTEVHSSKDLYDTLQQKLQQATIDTQLNSVGTLIVDGARVPTAPVEPKKFLTLASGLFLGLFVGVVSAFFLESGTDRIRSPELAEKALGVPLLASIPAIGKAPNGKPASSLGDLSDASSQLVVLKDPLSQSAEGYRVLRNTLLGTDAGSLKTALFASPVPDQSLSVVTSNFAVSLVQSGPKVLLVDIDLRNPGLHTIFGQDNGPGLGDFLAGETESLTTRQPVKGLERLYLVTAGKVPELPAECLASERFHKALKHFESTFDYVLLKAAPILAVSDSLPAAGWADHVVLVARYDVTGLSAVQSAMKLLKQSNASVAGFVISGGVASASHTRDQVSYGERQYA